MVFIQKKFANNNNCNRNVKKSYGVLCVTAQRPYYILLNHSPCYSSTQIIVNNNKLVHLNSQETYNIFLSSFPGYVGEGEYTLPRGRPEPIDQNNLINTKVREFIEETGYYHTDFERIVNKHYLDDKFTSIFNDKRYNIREEWVGLDEKKYSAEYTVFVIDKKSDLEKVVKTPNNVLDKFLFFKNAKEPTRTRYIKKYKYDTLIDILKKPTFIPLEDGLELLNVHRSRRILDLNKEDIKNIISFYKTQQ